MFFLLGFYRWLLSGRSTDLRSKGSFYFCFQFKGRVKDFTGGNFLYMYYPGFDNDWMLLFHLAGGRYTFLAPFFIILGLLSTKSSTQGCSLTCAYLRSGAGKPVIAEHLVSSRKEKSRKARRILFSQILKWFTRVFLPGIIYGGVFFKTSNS